MERKQGVYSCKGGRTNSEVRCVAGVHTSLRMAGGGERGTFLPSQVPTLMTRKWCLARPWRVFSNAPAVPPPYLLEFPPRNSHSDQLLGDFFSFLVVVKGDTEARREVRSSELCCPTGHASPTHSLTHRDGPSSYPSAQTHRLHRDRLLSARAVANRLAGVVRIRTSDTLALLEAGGRSCSTPASSSKAAALRHLWN